MKKSRPNILWICTDQQRFDTINALGHSHFRTPHLDRLAASGVAFTDVYCQNPICTPSRSSFLTGLYPSGLRANINGNETFANVAPLLPKTLADSGYLCGLVGKLHLASNFNGPERRIDDGYSLFRSSLANNASMVQGNQHLIWLQGKGLKLSDVFILDRFGNISYQRPDLAPELHQTSWVGLQTEDVIRSWSRLEQPWMLSANFFAPHPAWDPPDEYRRRYDPSALPPPHYRPGEVEIQRRLSAAVDFPGPLQAPDAAGQSKRADYYALIELIDGQVGRILDALEATGQRERTLVIFTSDHGEMLGDHGLFHKGCRFYEGAVRVPLIIGGLQSIRAGLRATGLVELTDLVPTLLEFAGLPPPRLTQGRSLVPILSGAADPAEHRETAWCEYFDTIDMSTVTWGTYAYNHSRATMIRDSRHKLILYHGTGLGELFDLRNDPWEHENLWERGEHRESRARLTSASLDRLAASIDVGPRRVGRY
jgi:arylsulfatase